MITSSARPAHQHAHKIDVPNWSNVFCGGDACEPLEAAEPGVDIIGFGAGAGVGVTGVLGVCGEPPVISDALGVDGFGSAAFAFGPAQVTDAILATNFLTSSLPG